MKKLITAIIVALGIIIVAAPSKPAQAQVAYCGRCCDIDPWSGSPRARCVLIEAIPCTMACQCAGIAGTGFACY